MLLASENGRSLFIDFGELQAIRKGDGSMILGAGLPLIFDPETGAAEDLWGSPWEIEEHPDGSS